MLGDLVDRVVDRSRSAVLLSLLDHRDIDADNVKKLRRLLNAKLKVKGRR